MQSLSLVMSKCFLSGRGQNHVNNFYIVDLENFATASRRYTGDIGLLLIQCREKVHNNKLVLLKSPYYIHTRRVARSLGDSRQYRDCLSTL